MNSVIVPLAKLSLQLAACDVAGLVLGKLRSLRYVRGKGKSAAYVKLLSGILLRMPRILFSEILRPYINTS